MWLVEGDVPRRGGKGAKALARAKAASHVAASLSSQVKGLHFDLRFTLFAARNEAANGPPAQEGAAQ